MAYIYKITNDINDKVYIGKTEFSIEKRFQEHCRDRASRKCEKRPLYNAMNKYGVEHFHIELIEETDKPEEREIYWIKQYNSYHNGYNATLGGDGKTYIDHQKIIELYLKYGLQTKVAEIMQISVDTVHNVLAQNNIKLLTLQEVQTALTGKQVEMYDKDGKFLNSFQTLKDAGRYLIENKKTKCKLSTASTHISEVCRGKRKTMAGYVWKFKED